MMWMAGMMAVAALVAVQDPGGFNAEMKRMNALVPVAVPASVTEIQEETLPDANYGMTAGQRLLQFTVEPNQRITFRLKTMGQLSMTLGVPAEGHPLLSGILRENRKSRMLRQVGTELENRDAKPQQVVVQIRGEMKIDYKLKIERKPLS